MELDTLKEISDLQKLLHEAFDRNAPGDRIRDIEHHLDILEAKLQAHQDRHRVTNAEKK